MTPPVAFSVAAIFALMRAEDSRLAGMFAWLASDWTTPEEAFSIAVCNYKSEYEHERTSRGHTCLIL